MKNRFLFLEEDSMAKSRGNGQGSVTKLKDKKGKVKYQVRVTTGCQFDAEKEKVRYTQD